MEGPTLLYSHSAFGQPPPPLPASVSGYYSSYHTPPYTHSYASHCSCPEVLYHPLSMSEDVLHMQQQLRFPTPPLTPPRIPQSIAPHAPQALEDHISSAAEVAPLRTRSVIMKVGHKHSPQHISDYYEDYNSQTEEEQIEKLSSQHHLQPHDTPSSGTSSPTSSNDFYCDWLECGRYFESLDLLAIHVTQIHAVASLNDGLYYCRWSGCQRTQRGFNARYKMLVHVRTHTKEKPHQCHMCDKRFSRAENLKIHIRSHSGEKPYICTFEGCKKAYSNSSDRFKHTRTHSMEKPYMCKVPGCQKRYTDPSSLRKHVKTFKHSMQIIDSKTVATTAKPYQTSFSYQQQLDESRFSPLEQVERNYPAYHLIMAAPAPSVAGTQDTFCMAMEEMCHIRATLDSYKSTSTVNGDTANCWLHDETDGRSSPCHSAYAASVTSNSEHTMDLTIEKPLDLRVNRC